jgi:hypothetical protein
MLKSFDKIYEPDPRFENIALAFHHEIVASILLSGNPPDDVRNAFDRARNLMLYAHFHYEMLMNAEIQAFGAFELALRIKLNGTPKQTLQILVDRARKEGVLPKLNAGHQMDSINGMIKLRNELSHGTSSVHSPPMAETMLEFCGAMIDLIFPKNALK